MDSENESMKLVSAVVTDRTAPKQYVPETNDRDFDSMNNLVVNESDGESTLNNGKIHFHDDEGLMGSRGCNINETFKTTGIKGNRVIMIGDKGVDITSRLCFKDEFDKHRHVLEKGMKEGSIHTDIQYKASTSKSIWRSFISLCIGLFFAFMSFMPLRNILTSLYPWRHLGNYSLAAMYLSFAIGCLFSNWITQNSRPKGIILVAMFGHLIFCAANIYPSAYTLIPASSFFGFCHAPLWSTQELMIASYGASYTAISHMTISKTIHQFQSVFLVFCHASQVLGNLIESAILRSGDYEQSRANMSVYLYRLEKDLYENGIEITNITDRKVDTSDNLVWVGPFGYKIQPDLGLSSGDKPNYETIVKLVFIAFAVIGMTILCLFLNKPDIIVHKKKTTLCEMFRAIRKFLTTGTFYALFLLMLFSGMQQAVVIGNVTKLYGSLTLGISMVGYMMMCYGTCQLIVLLIMEKVYSQLRASIAIFNAFLITLGLLVWLYIWEPGSDNLFKVIAYVAVWGATDGLWQSQVQNVLLSWSTGRKDAAVTVYRTVQSLGLALVFILDIYVSLLNMICVCCAVLVVGVMLYLLMEVIRTPHHVTEPLPFAL